MKNITEYLKKHSIQPTYQRIKIYEYLSKNKTHPTADEIYRALVKENPTLSKTTVYNTLNFFVEKEIVLLITIEENEARYDADTSVHGHFKCKKCGKVYDFKVTHIEAEGLEMFQIDEKGVYYKGVCKECL